MQNQSGRTPIVTLKQREQALQDMAQKALALAIELGADEAFISTSYGVQSKIAYEKGDYNLATRHEGEGLTITVHINKASGCASVNSLDSQLIQDTITKALHLARHSVPDEFIVLAEPSTYPKLEQRIDPRITDLKMDQLIQFSQTFVESCTKSPYISIDSASLECSSGVRLIANTKGMIASEHHSSLNWSVMGMAIQDDDITSFDYTGNHSQNLDHAKEKIEASSREFSEKLLRCLGAQKAESYRGQVMLNPSLVEELLIDPLIYHIQGSNIMDGKSRWDDAIGTRITHPNFHLEDHPHDTELRGCTAFSGEGVPTQKMTVIEHGILKTHIDSLYSANRRGATPTGNGGGLHAPVMKAGPTSREKLINQSRGPLLIPSRFSGNIDPLSGDFSGVAKGSLLYRDGELVGPVKEIMISGNIFELLQTELLISSELEDDGGYYRLPHILIDGISVTAN